MSTGIEWTDETWNPVTGCTKVSQGCKNCYAERVAERLWGQQYASAAKPYVLGRPRRFTDVWLHADRLARPLGWKKPRRIFVNSMSDLFHENVPFDFIAAVFGVMAASPQHAFQVLTKRPRRALEWFAWVQTRFVSAGATATPRGVLRLTACAAGLGECAPFDLFSHWNALGNSWPLPNVWLGVSVEDQATADERLPLLLRAPAAVRFVSYEPALGPVDFSALPSVSGHGKHLDALMGCAGADVSSRLDWIIAGGESGPGARPAHPDWFRSVRDQCSEAGVPFFFKQWGEYSAVYDRDKDDPDWLRCGDFERSSLRGQWLNLAGGCGFHGDRVLRVERVGVKKAGRELDGRTWDQFPEVR